MSAIKFKVVVFNDGCFIANAEAYSSCNSQIPNLLFDDVKAIQSCKKDWYKLDKVPTTITKMSLGGITINHRYELKDSIKFDLQKVYKREDFAYYDIDDGWLPLSEYEDIYSLYKLVYDIQEATLEMVSFTIETVQRVNCNLVEPNDTINFNYSYFVVGSYNNKTGNLTDASVQYKLVNELTTPDLFIDNTSCCLTAQQSYDIVRLYIKQNIDNTWATLTDYDFCLRVEKNINLEKVEVYEAMDIVLGKKKSKPKTITKYRNNRKISIFECCPKPYEKHTVIMPFKGNSLQDLKNNIDKYLSDLIKKINRPLVDCSHCKGLGVIDFIDSN